MAGPCGWCFFLRGEFIRLVNLSQGKGPTRNSTVTNILRSNIGWPGKLDLLVWNKVSTRWAPSSVISYKWSCGAPITVGSYNLSYPVSRPFIGVITQLITSRGLPNSCSGHQTAGWRGQLEKIYAKALLGLTKVGSQYFVLVVSTNAYLTKKLWRFDSQFDLGRCLQIGGKKPTN